MLVSTERVISNEQNSKPLDVSPVGWKGIVKGKPRIFGWLSIGHCWTVPKEALRETCAIWEGHYVASKRSKSTFWLTIADSSIYSKTFCSIIFAFKSQLEKAVNMEKTVCVTKEKNSPIYRYSHEPKAGKMVQIAITWSEFVLALPPSVQFPFIPISHSGTLRKVLTLSVINKRGKQYKGKASWQRRWSSVKFRRRPVSREKREGRPKH